jgi:5-methyltetrahydropteroyltriglutamate--homocysteine methyltransferase
MSLTIANLGFPRIGPRRELKKSLESFWSGKSNERQLSSDAAALRASSWKWQADCGVTCLPSNDFSLYDHVLDTTALLGAVPRAYGWDGGSVPIDVYFAMARGSASTEAMEMTKWFDTNYHYIVPSFTPDQRFSLAFSKVVDEFIEARELGYLTRPVLLGPVSYLRLGKRTDGGSTLEFLSSVLPSYLEVLRRLASAGARWVQIDEPCLVLDLDTEAREAIEAAYGAIAKGVEGLDLMLATYFGALEDNLDLALRLPVAGLHVDLVRGPQQLKDLVVRAPRRMALSLGIVDGRNVWGTNLRAVLDRVEPIVERRGIDNVIVAPSCSLLHVPIDLELETGLDPALKSWMAFAVQKLTELRIVGRALIDGRNSVSAELAASDEAAVARASAPAIHNAMVRRRLGTETPEMLRRSGTFARRNVEQRKSLGLPLLPTTTIGSFPQTDDVRKARASSGRGTIDADAYRDFLRQKTRAAVEWQQEIGLDVLVHGEFERNDMVQYFGERLDGFAFTQNGWVQSYGSRCVRPPVIFGDVSRPAPMTVEWAAFAQSLTDKPLKGMLTGPVTILQWSFVRDDTGRDAVCRQLAFALRDEVTDLEGAGIRVIQIDEPALREGLPLRRRDWKAYLDWAVACFRIAACGVADSTQIQTHMCYAEFNDIVDAIVAMDADVILIEATRSKMELLDVFAEHGYPNNIGPGIYDIHAPRVPSINDMRSLLELAMRRLHAEQLWVTPDCGLKTRTWEEVRPALVNMVQAAKRMRESLATQPT